MPPEKMIYISNDFQIFAFEKKNEPKWIIG